MFPENEDHLWTTYEFASDVWIDQESEESSDDEYVESVVSLNGFLYWISNYDINNPLCYIDKYDFSNALFVNFCELPCGEKIMKRMLLSLGSLVLGDKLSSIS